MSTDNLIEKLSTYRTPAYNEEKKKFLRQNMCERRLNAVAVIASIAYCIFGTTFCCKDRFSNLMIGLSLTYLSGNTYRTCANEYDILENPQKYHHIDGVANKALFRKQLLQGTIGFNWWVDLFLKVHAESMR